MAGARRAPAISLEVAVENRTDRLVRFDLAVEWAIMLLGGGANPAAYYAVGDELEPHDGSGELTAAGSIRSGNTFVGLDIATSFEPVATVWWTPIETISNSEYGFERIYQGSALVGVWQVELAPGERRTVAMDQRVTTDRDRALDV
jgi:alpha-amylase